MVPMPASVNSSSSRLCGTRAVDDVSGLGAAADRVDAGGELRPHAAVDPRQLLLDLAHRGARDQRSLLLAVAEPADHIGKEDRLVGAERGGDLAGRLVGVDVVGMPSRSQAEEAMTGM